MIVDVIIGLTIFTYGVNFLVFLYLKYRPKRDWLERLSIYFGVNMSLLLADGVFLFLGKIFEEGILVIE
ncbi:MULTISPECIES: hypothetical protein [Enterococcus]|uniref:hypothetical protein n=1 Tax=Enterococcus TaxID=1350 RepID=UPI00065DCB03|nr:MULTISPECIES: hypothetical protein [Enterococcus]KAF1300610.1 hypothetical protein BAU16_12480 [Enterococcus sp. JM9B]